MITQIEIDGFKTFLDFKVELAPFQVLVGPNASGKSNLFDALHLLSRLAEVDIRSAFQDLRGSPDDQFTLFPDGRRSDHIRIAVELLVDRKVQDELGQRAELKYTRLRYEVTIIQFTDTYGLDQLQVQHESLVSIPFEQDSWCRKCKLSHENGWLPELVHEKKVFIDMQITKGRITKSVTPPATSQTEYLMIYLYPDSDQAVNTKRFYADEVQRTILSRTGEVDYPHIFAVREDLRSLKFLHLNPEALRQASSFKAPTFLSREGNNLAAMLNRMQIEDEFALTDVSRDVANLVPGIVKVRIDKKEAQGEYNVYAQTSDQRSFSAKVLSDGSLRLLAIAALNNDPHLRGVLCLEEPDEGIHVIHLQAMTHLLRGMTTDFTDAQQVDEPLKQILITTHSPSFISQPDAMDSLLYVVTSMLTLSPDSSPLKVTRMFPVVVSATQLTQDTDKAAEVYTIEMVRQYLTSSNLDSAREQLKKARHNLLEGQVS